MTKKSICDTLRRTCLILAGSLIMAMVQSFVRTGGLIPGGFSQSDSSDTGDQRAAVALGAALLGDQFLS